MVKLVIVKNPFQPWENREIKHVPYGFTVKQITKMIDFNGTEINCIVNGNTIEEAENYIIPDNQMVVISPVVGKGRGGKILGMIIGLALMVVGGVWAVGAKVLGVGASVGIGVSTGLVGSFLISYAQSAYAKSIGACNYETSTNDATYSWSGVQTMEGQNNPITLTYGKVKSGGQTIGKYINVNDDKEYLNWLVSAGEGELEISNIQLNDNATSYYEGVEVETRSGTNDQSIISNFNDTYFTKELGYQLLETERIDKAQGNNIQGLKVGIEFSNGLYYANDEGGLDEAWVEIKISYRIIGGSWNIIAATRITGKKSSALRKDYRVDNLPAGEYEVSVKVTNRSHEVTNSRASVRCYWKSLTSIVYDDFEYPNIALIGIKALATDQLSGSPKLTFMKERKYVWVYNNNSGEYEQRASNNPAWASYDMLHQASKLKNINTGEYKFDIRGVPAKHIIYEQFKEWADFCDEKELYVNIEVTQCGEMLETINGNVALCGRGSVIRFGTRYGCIWKCAKQPTQMFGMGNIISGTMQEEFLQTTDRANCVELTYNDANMDYERNVITIYGDNYDSDSEERISSVTYNGITSYNQAYREAKFLLYSNQYQLRTVSFEANIDAIACTVGDVVLVSHDVPFWANSGRIYEVDVANNEMLLPVEIENPSGTYRIMYRTVNDNIYTSNVTIISNANGWCRIKLATNFNANDLPQANDIFDIAKNVIGSKPFIVQSISRANDFTRKIECLEYNENIYEENYTIPEIEYSVNDTSIENVKNLVAKQNKVLNSEGVYQYVLEANWEYDKQGTFSIYGSYDGYNFTCLDSMVNGRSYSNVYQYELIYIKVITKNSFVNSSGVTERVTLINKVVLPSATNVKAYNKYRELTDDVSRYDVVVEWSAPTFSGYKQSVVWYKTNGTQCNNIGVIPSGVVANDLGYYGDWIYGGQGYNSVVIPQAIIGDTYKIVVCTEDMYGNAQNPNTVTPIELTIAMKTETPDTPNGVGVSITDTFNITWDDVRNADIKYYEVRLDNSFGVDSRYLLARTTETKLYTDLVTDRSGTIYVFAVSAYDKVSAPAKLIYNFLIPNSPTITCASKLSGIECKASAIPSNCNSIHWYFEGTDSYYDVVSDGVTYFYQANSGVYEISACYQDYFGYGNVCSKVMVTIQAYVDDSLIKIESISVEKLSATAQDAIKNGGVNSVNIAVKGILDSGSALVLQDDGSYALVASNGKKLTGLFANESGAIRLQGDYIHCTGTTKFDNGIITNNILAGGITADKISVTSLSAISATLGTMETVSADGLSKTIIKGSGGAVYSRSSTNASWVLRVRWGIW